MTVPKLRFPEFRDAGEWEGKKLGEVCECIVPGRDKPKSFTGDIPWITIPDIQGLKIYSSANKLGLSVDEIRECGAKIVPKHSVIMSCVGTFGLISICGRDLVINQQLHAWLSNPKVNNYYLAHSLILQKKQMERMATNTTIAYLNKNGCNAVIIPLTALPEQQKIADCLSSLDDRITAETQKLDKLKVHKKGLMQQLFPAEGETLPKLRFPEFRDAGEWEVKPLGNKTMKVGSGITPNGGEKNYKSKGRPFIRSQNVGWGCLLLEDVAFIDDVMHSTFSTTEINKEDVFLNITGASIGRSAVADYRVQGGNVNQHVCIIRTKQSELNPYYLNQYLLSQYGQKQIDSFQAGGNRQGLNFAQVRSFSLPLPLIEEQQKIAACLSSIDELITAQTQKIDTLKVHKKGLMQQLFPSVEEVKG